MGMASSKKVPLWVWIVSAFGVVAILGITTIYLLMRRAADLAASIELKESMMKTSRTISVAFYSASYRNGYKYPSFNNGVQATAPLYLYLKDAVDMNRSQKMAWNLELSGVAFNRVKSPSTTWVFHTPKPDDDGMTIVSFCDEHIEMMDKKRLSDFLAIPSDLEPETTH